MLSSKMSSQESSNDCNCSKVFRFWGWNWSSPSNSGHIKAHRYLLRTSEQDSSRDPLQKNRWPILIKRYIYFRKLNWEPNSLLPKASTIGLWSHRLRWKVSLIFVIVSGERAACLQVFFRKRNKERQVWPVSKSDTAMECKHYLSILSIDSHAHYFRKQKLFKSILLEHYFWKQTLFEYFIRWNSCFEVRNASMPNILITFWTGLALASVFSPYFVIWRLRRWDCIVRADRWRGTPLSGVQLEIGTRWNSRLRRKAGWISARGTV